jgi:hypothetical protein
MYGDVRSVIHADFQGNKFVAVGAELHYSPAWRTFHDFLLGYIRTVCVRAFGKDWAPEEMKKPVKRRHPILRWYDAVCDLQSKGTPGADGIREYPMDGPTAAYLLLAYDFYILADNMRLQDQVLGRMRDGNHFQGARYELTVAATMIRAGFEIAYEDESDNRRRHPEFIATHKQTGEVIAVEAKSRRRSGVMGWLGPKPEPDVNTFRLGLDDLLRNAIAKGPQRPYLIFLDANMPPELAWPEGEKEWVTQAREMVKRIGHGFNRVGIFEGVPFTALYITNFPHDYVDRGVLDPGKVFYVTQPTMPKYPLRFHSTIAQIDKALRQYGNIPKEFPEF